MKNLIIGHRGGSTRFPENTLEAVLDGWDHVNKVEIDVRLSKDEKIVVIHDEDTFRTSGEKKNVSTSTLEELRNVNVGDYLGLNDFKIRDLEEVFDAVPKYKKIIVEVKSGIEILPSLKNYLQKFNHLINQIEFISFNYDVVRGIKKINSNLTCLWLLDLDYYDNDDTAVKDVNEIKKLLIAGNLDGIDAYNGLISTSNFLKSFLDDNFVVYLWTINELESIKKIIQFNIDGITTDFPEKVLKELNHSS